MNNLIRYAILPLPRNQRSFSNDKPGVGTLDIVFLHDFVRYCLGSTITRQRAHGNPILDCNVAQLKGFEENRGRGHVSVERFDETKRLWMMLFNSARL